MKNRNPNIYKKLLAKLKSNPDVISISECPIRNSDIVRLLELTGKQTKSDAISFAVESFINSAADKSVYKSSLEEKLEKLRYGKMAAHEASNDLIDTEIAKNVKL